MNATENLARATYWGIFDTYYVSTSAEHGDLVRVYVELLGERGDLECVELAAIVQN